jgi:hypothetical protein
MREKKPSKVSSPPIHQSKDSTDFLLAEYIALRAEILKRIELQHQLITLSLVATGTFLSVGLQGSPTLILTYPILAMFIGAAWSQSALRISQMGTYIRRRIEEGFLSGELGWEHMRANTDAPFFGSLSIFMSRGIFVGTQILAVFAALLKTTFSQADIILFPIDGIAIVITIFLIRRFHIDEIKFFGTKQR